MAENGGEGKATGARSRPQPRPMASATCRRMSASCSAVIRDGVARTRDCEVAATNGETAKQVFEQPF